MAALVTVTQLKDIGGHWWTFMASMLGSLTRPGSRVRVLLTPGCVDRPPVAALSRSGVWRKVPAQARDTQESLSDRELAGLADWRAGCQTGAWRG
jgi:hypothetical protein